jgi:RHH-type proline utilization regulon transcriptional repressor/proline dehydrogenase/delta 1-pyrroline-5-carboxylate dehydrogenase
LARDLRDRHTPVLLQESENAAIGAVEGIDADRILRRARRIARALGMFCCHLTQQRESLLRNPRHDTQTKSCQGVLRLTAILSTPLQAATTDSAPSELPSCDSAEHVMQMKVLAEARRLPVDMHRVAQQAADWTEAARAEGRLSHYEAMLEAFGLVTPEGKALMRLAEALLRTPDHATAWRLLCENVCDAGWLAPRTARPAARLAATLLRWTAAVLSRHEPSVRWLAVPILSMARSVIASVSEQFVVADTVPQALARMRRDSSLGLCSLDCLGESARSAAQAQRYFQAYQDTIAYLAAQPTAGVHMRHGLSVKLTALEPKFGPTHRSTYDARLIPRLLRLAQAAAAANIGLTIDAEEQDRLESTLDVLAVVMDHRTTADWDGLGLAVQAYGLRSLQVIAWLADKARVRGRRITVRLVKGAYWDGEIKRAQERGLDRFPVFTDKRMTDVSYLVAAQHLFDQSDVIFPQFATHNALTVAAVRAMAPTGAAFEFQRLHGMGEQLYRVASRAADFPRVRVYAPVGSRQDLLAYLIRRLLENGANSSFVRQFLDPGTPQHVLLEDPISSLTKRPSWAQSAHDWLSHGQPREQSR